MDLSSASGIAKDIDIDAQETQEWLQALLGFATGLRETLGRRFLAFRRNHGDVFDTDKTQGRRSCRVKPRTLKE